MKKLIIIALLLAGTAGAQEVVIDSTKYERLVAEANARIPIGSLAGKMGVSPEAGLWYRTKVSHNDMMDWGGTVFVPLGRKDFEYKTQEGVWQTKAVGVSGMVGCRMNKLYSVANTTLEWSTSFGYAFFTFHDEASEYAHKNFPERYEDNNSGYIAALSTFHLGQGLRLQVKNYGLQLHYNYTPYGLFSKHVVDNFGSHSLSVGVWYRQ